MNPLKLSGMRGRLAPALAMAVVVACGGTPPPVPPAPAVDSAAVRARADALAEAARTRDALEEAARRDAAEAARTDSLSRLAARHARADSVRAEVLRDGGAPAPAVAGVLSLDAAATEALARPVSFDYDRFDLSSGAVALLEEKLMVLRANPTLVVVIEGHCDERGSDEYNLALGNRRAAAVKRYLVEHGIAEDRLSIVSFGEERPADPAQNEAAWARNRRAEFRARVGT